MKGFFKIVFATLVALFVFFGLSAMLSMCTLMGIASMSQSETVLTEHSVLRLKLSGAIVERSESEDMESLRNLMGDNASTVAIGDVRVALKRAAANVDKIDAVYLDCGMLGGAPASIEELRELLVRFKEETGLPIVAYADSYTQGSYWLATVADSVFLNPHGTLALSGMTMNTMFMRKAMDKIGVEMQIFKVGTFKSAVEPYMLDKMSDANRLQMTKVTDGIWGAMAMDIAEARGVERAVVDGYVDAGGFLRGAELALEMGLVDGLKYRKDVTDMMEEVWSDDVHFVSVGAMRRVPDNASYKANKVAVLYASGGIDDGSTDGIDSEKVVKELNRLADDDKVKAVVMRVNSPGGSAYGSEQMWDAARRLKEKKPLVVSMGDYAASGGYYMSCIADTILARRTTLTGSIGIFGMFPNVEGLTEKIGVSFDGVKSHELADFGNITRPMTGSERALLQSYIEQGYETFVGRCAESRGMSVDAIKAVAEGRVWLGGDALELQLVDVMGGLDDAIGMAAEMAGLTDNYAVAEYPKQKDLYTMLLEQMSGEMEVRALKSVLGDDARWYEWYRRLAGATGVQALMPYYVEM